MQHLILDTNGLIIKKRNQCFWIISKKSNYRLLSPKRLKSIVVIADVMMSTAATHLAVINDIPIYYCNKNGQLYGTIRNKSYKGVESLRIKQVLWSMGNDARAWALDIYRSKIAQQFEFFQKTKTDFMHKKLDLDLYSERFFVDLRAIEAGVGKEYWGKYREQLPVHIVMKSRAIRPAEDIVNVLLNYFYGFLYTIVEQAIWTNGLNPYIEVVHRQHHQKPVLAYDIIEPYRSIVDGYVLEIICSGIAKSTYFGHKANGVVLTSEGKRQMIPPFLRKLDDKVTIDNHKTTWQKHIYRTVYQLRQRIENSKEYDQVSDYLRHSK